MNAPADAVGHAAGRLLDTEAFERSVGPEARRLFGLALAILGDHGEAEDAVQETMFSAWRAWSTLRQASGQSAWLTRICVNVCIPRRRTLMRRILWFSEQWSRPLRRLRALCRASCWGSTEPPAAVAASAGGLRAPRPLRLHRGGMRRHSRLPSRDRSQPPWPRGCEVAQGVH